MVTGIEQPDRTAHPRHHRWLAVLFLSLMVWVTSTSGQASEPSPPEMALQTAPAAQEPAQGSIDKALIRRNIRRHLNEIKACYESELTQTPTLEGRIVTQFTINQRGAVEDVKLLSLNVTNPSFEQCIKREVGTWVFPKPETGKVVVSYPFVFRIGYELTACSQQGCSCAHPPC